MMLTDEIKIDKYPVASMEDSKIATEQQYYDIDASKIVLNNYTTATPSYTNGDNGVGNNPNDPTFDAAGSQKMYRLKGNENKTGLGITLKVMAGDVIDIWGRSYYFDNNTGGTSANSALPIADLLTAFLGGATGSGATAVHGAVTPAEINTTGNVAGINSMFSSQTTQNNGYPTKPKAFINYILFDEQFKAVDYRVSMIEPGATRTKQHHGDLSNITVPKNGFVYIYCSNESPVNVFFDNLQVVHTKGPILEETHYYPFGLTMAGISSKAASSMQNKHKYNGIELNEDFDVNIYDAFYRNLDVQTGRWWQIDPKLENQEALTSYNAMANDPVLKSDPLGDEDEESNGDGDPVKAAAAGALVLEAEAGVAITVGAGALAVVGSTAIAIGFIAAHPEALLTSKSAGQQDLAVERQIIKNANAPEPAVTTSPLGGGATAAGRSFAKGANNLGTQKAQEIGQEAHRQKQKVYRDANIPTEQTITLKNGQRVRKDAILKDGTPVIIKPDTKTGRASAAKRKGLLEKFGNNKKQQTPIIDLYDPNNPAYQPGSPSYIGPGKKTN